ncbi:MAG TPA: hypothetical protein VGI78_12700 [Acetobacteraceae bacterium]|jgi:hypothetical protein
MEPLGDIARNLLNLEVNTILCDGITAEKMPGVADALTNIAQRYQRFLRNRMTELQQAGIEISTALPGIIASGARIEFEDWQVQAADLATFEALRRAAQCCIAALHGQPLHDWGSQEIIFDRIRGNAEQIKAIYRGLGQADIAADAVSIDVGGSLVRPQTAAPTPLLSQGEVVLVRKIWEVGTEEIAMQTVVLIDGDVFNRIQSGWQTDAEQALHALHRQAVETSVAQWTNLFRIAAELIGSVFQGFFRSTPPGPDSVPGSA